MMLTFTIDPELFPGPDGPRDAFEYASQHRVMSVTIQRLKRFGLLPANAKWFCVVEWQKDTQMPHWHLLIDAAWIEYGGRRNRATGQFDWTTRSDGRQLLHVWNANWPDWRARVDARRPGFGSVRFPRVAELRT